LLEIKGEEAAVKGFSEPKRQYTLGLLGAGTVGGGLIKLLQGKHLGYTLPVSIKSVGVRNLSKARSFTLPGVHISDDLEGIVEDETIDIIVEAMGGLEPARTYIEKALRAGKHVVTANKYVVSEYGDSLQELADSRARLFLYEASVAGAIPIVEILGKHVIPDTIHSIYAILNSTSNFILTRMTESGESFHASLLKAQELGYSEPDPSLDVSGKDASQKLAILISILKRQYCPPAQISARGIEFLTPDDFKFAAEHHWVIKALAVYQETGGRGFALVEPVFLPKDSTFSNVSDEYNALFFDCQNIGRQVIIGKGAGGLPTASAILSDLRKITAADGERKSKTEGQRTEREDAHGAITESGTQTDGLPICVAVENPRPYRFYIRTTCVNDPEKEIRIRECIAPVGELIQDRGLGHHSPSGFVALTKEIPQAELDRVLNSVYAFDRGAHVSWLRILRGV
jgi:homoserine dehydrogenase